MKTLKTLKALKALKALCLLLLFPLTASAQGCWTIGCRAFSSGPSGPATWTHLAADNGASCSAGSTCTLTFSPVTTANSVFLVAAYFPDSNSISSLTFPTGCAGSAETWTGGSGSSYAAFNTPSPGGMAWAYNLGNSGGCISITVNLTSAESGSWSFNTIEFTRSTGTPTLDALASTNTNTSSCTSCTGASFTSLSGASDLIVQVTNTGSGTSSPSSPYVWDTNQFASYALNSIQLTAPTWTQSSGGFQAFGVAFK